MKKVITATIVFFVIVIGQYFMPIKKESIYVYNDSGVSEESLTHTISFFKKNYAKNYNITAINAAQIKITNWYDDAALFVMPGGADIPYARKLNGQGNKIIKDYVNNGGSYLGICAGSYYASAKIEFDKDGPLEVIGTREIDFFPGIAKGPVLAPFKYKSNSGTRAANIVYNNNDVSVFYNGGPYFILPEKAQNIETLAYYNYEQKSLPAIVKVKYGQGLVILSGVHFEYDTYKLDKNDVYLKKIIPILSKNKNETEKLAIDLIKHLGI